MTNSGRDWKEIETYDVSFTEQARNFYNHYKRRIVSFHEKNEMRTIAIVSIISGIIAWTLFVIKGGG